MAGRYLAAERQETNERPSRSEIVDLYKVAVDEYRFQINLNWDRARYYVIFNAGLVGTGFGLLRASDRFGGYPALLVFVVGGVACGMCAAAVKTGHGYYKGTRAQMKTIAERLRLGPFAIQTTPGMGSPIARIAKITNMIYLILACLALVDIAGIVAASEWITRP